MEVYRVELVEKTTKYGEIERISSPCKNNDELIKEVLYFKNSFQKEIENETYFIKIIYVNIQN